METHSSFPRRLAFAGAVLAIGAAVALGFYQSSRSQAMLKRMAEDNNIHLAAALADALRSQFMPLVNEASGLGADKLKSHPAISSLRQAMVGLLRDTNLVKVKIYDRQGLTVFSTDVRQIGEDKSKNPGYLVARGGGVISDITHRDTFDAFEHAIYSRDLSFTYIPVRGLDGQVDAVFEIYSDVTEIQRDITNAGYREIAVVISVLATMYGLLLLAVVAGHRAQARTHENNMRLAANAARAESASRAKSEFLANMGHELRTPLNAIIGFSELIEGETLGPLGAAKYKEYATDIHKSGAHLLAVIDDVLDLAKAESGTMEVAKAAFDAGEEIRSAVAMLRGRAQAAGVALGVNLSPGLPQALGDALRLKQIVINLVGNAIKFSRMGGEVVISARAAPRSGMLEIEIADNGAGIAPEDMPLTMAPFGQVDSDLSRRYEGTGLGLPLSKKLAELMGGELRIASQPGVGTKATVTLPVTQVAEVKVPA